ncbi:MAG TPA: S-adenosylmethionine:tRNA ribosyltransferase-isomerase, partial [Gammaproteobacteria bacterium]|nr:S-adenosylmethionine:tRNA ribosyltransferase-isomerase [Gammaproteobacteria bacterium]
MPASLGGIHAPTGTSIEVRLAGRRSLDVADIRELDAIVFGEGDFRVPTERRPAPPALARGDLLHLGPLRAVVRDLLGHPRFVRLRFAGTPDRIWEGLARHGRPIQYSHLPEPLALWDVWTSNAALPVAFEPPSAGFVLSWKVLEEIRARGARLATLTHAAGLSSTGDPELDRRLPLDEPYFVPPATAEAVRHAKRSRARVIAVGTTVVRALEHAAAGFRPFARAGFGTATQRLGPASALSVV